MEVKPFAVPLPAPVPILPIAAAPMPMPFPAPVPVPHHDHIHLHAAYKHMTVLAPPVQPAFVAPYTSTASILVLFILLIIITRSFFLR